MTTQITIEDYWHGNEKTFASELTEAIRANAEETVSRANLLLFYMVKAGVSLVAKEGRSLVSSGWRPAAVNSATPNAATKSNHLTGRAVDLFDPTGNLDAWCLANQSVLKDIGLWLESPASTPTWCHVQTVAPKSGNRVFYP